MNLILRYMCGTYINTIPEIRSNSTMTELRSTSIAYNLTTVQAHMAEQSPHWQAAHEFHAMPFVIPALKTTYTLCAPTSHPQPYRRHSKTCLLAMISKAAMLLLEVDMHQKDILLEATASCTRQSCLPHEPPLTQTVTSMKEKSSTEKPFDVEKDANDKNRNTSSLVRRVQEDGQTHRHHL